MHALVKMKIGIEMVFEKCSQCQQKSNALKAS
jgi:hypothetical protein